MVQSRRKTRGWLIFILAGAICLSGCTEWFAKNTESPTDGLPSTVLVNGEDMSGICSVITREETIYISALEVMQKLGAVAFERSGDDHTLFIMVTEEHNLYHEAASGEVYHGGQEDDSLFVALSQPSVVENGRLYVVPGFFGEVLSAQVTTGSNEIAIDLTRPAASLRLQGLNSESQTSYFDHSSLSRYIAYLKEHTEADAHQAVVHVNADLDKPFFTDVTVITVPDEILVLCNKYNQLPKDYKPKDLVYITDGYYLRTEAADAYKEMIKIGAQEGYAFQLKSAFRSYETQTELYNNQVARVGKERAETVSARPGHSEHQTGLSIDVTQPTGDYGLSSANFEKTPQYTWLSQHAHEFGFILRYQADTTQITGFVYEPWHYRYVGKDVAKVIYDEKLTYEEYCAMYRFDPEAL